MYDSIVGRHEGIKVEETLYSEEASLESYADAAAKMGAKVWVKEANEWMWNFAVSFFRRNGARKEFLRHARPYVTDETFDALEQVLVKDLMMPRGQEWADPAKIRLLDVGSCYNPIRHSASEPAFDCLAVDLHPAHPSVRQADFLQVGIHEGGGNAEDTAVQYHEGHSPAHNDKVARVKSLPAGSFDAVSMSLVLSYLPDPSQRREMVRRARRLLVSPPVSSSTGATMRRDMAEPDSHRAGLLLIAEKQSIFNSIPAEGARNQSDSLVEGWKQAVAEEGFRLVKYRQMRSSDGRQSHLFAFRTVDISSGGDGTTDSHSPVSSQQGRGSSTTQPPLKKDEVNVVGRSEMWIRQDFVGEAGETRLPSGQPADATTDPGSSNGLSDPYQALPHQEPETGEGGRRERQRPAFARVPSEGDPLPCSTRLRQSLLPPVAVVGGGLGGCALALSLRRAGVPVVVFEKDDSFSARKQGYALTMQQGSSVLDGELGISMEMLLQPGTGLSSLTHMSMDKHGRRLGLYGATAAAAKRATTERAARRANKRRHNVHIPRQKLRELLLRGLGVSVEGDEANDSDGYNTGQGQVVMWSKELVGYSQRTKHIQVPLRHGSDKSGVQHISRPWPVLDLRFADGSSFECSALVGADGIFSRVRTLMEEKQHDAQTQTQAQAQAQAQMRGGGLQYLGIVVILGISPVRALEEGYSLIDQAHMEGGGREGSADGPSEEQGRDYSRRQTQWLDGTTRVFSMPFGDGEHMMWQLSFPMAEAEALSLSSLSALAAEQDPSSSAPAPAPARSQKASALIGARLKEEALRRCAGWHAPLVSLLQATPVADISGHPVYDRDASPLPASAGLQGHRDGLVVLMGDAAHPMSPFKGQGANQALLDASSLARELKRSRAAFGDTVTVTRPGADAGAELEVEIARGQPVPEALKVYEAEMVERASEKVLRSREAARLLHGEQALREGDLTRASAAAAPRRVSSK